MGQKVNPHGLRVGVISGWNTTWYADKKEFSKFLKEDNVIRTFLKKKYYAAAVSKILIERAAANAENNMGMDRNDLYVAECFADGGQMLKRMQPVSKGRGHAILKRTSHITVILDVKKLEGEDK